MEWVLLAVVALILWLLYEGWSTMIAHGQFAVVGVGAGLLAFGILATYIRYTLRHNRLHALGAALADSYLHVVALAPMRVVVQENGAEKFLGRSRAQANVFLAFVTAVTSGIAHVVAFHSLDIAYMRFDGHYIVEPQWALLWVVLGAVWTVRAALRRFDPHAVALASARDLLQESRPASERQLTDANAARDVALNLLCDAVAVLGAPFDRALHKTDRRLPVDPASLLGVLRADEARVRTHYATVAQHLRTLDRVRSRLDLLERDLDGAPASQRARDAQQALDDASAALQMLGQRLGMPGHGALVDDIRDLGRCLQGLERDVDAACRGGSGGTRSGTSGSSRPKSPYDVLGISPGASPEEIKAAYRRKALETHPDCGGDAAAFRAVRAAYDALSGA